MNEELTAEDLVIGLIYVRISTGSPLIVRPLELGGNGMKCSLALPSSGIFSPSHGLSTNGSKFRKATVKEEVHLEECEKAKMYISEDAALAAFLKRFPTGDVGKRFRIGYVDKHGIDRSRVVAANDVEEAVKQIPDLVSMNYNTAL